MYTLFVPARARLAFPCFDQPDLKARYSLTLEIPKGWEALANGQESARQERGDRLTLTFAETPPLPTYLFAFAAGRFQIETADRQGRRFRMFHRETDAAKVARNREAIFDLHAASLEWLERYTGIPYPFGKFDFLLVPSFQFGGMEHAGAIFYNASGLLLDQSATQNQLLGRASVIAHETSHMWFGDLVTMRWFNDVWMKEVFANFMAAKIVNPSFPQINHELRFLLTYYPAAYEVDRTAGTNAIRQRLDNLDEAGTLYGAIIYQKAPIVMRQLEMMLGEDGFRDGLREYLGAHRFANATWADLIRVLDARTAEDLETWSRTWIEEAGRPVITTDLRVENGRIARLALVQRDPAPRRGLVWTERIQMALGYDDEIRRIPVSLNAARVDVPEARGLPAPRFALPTGGGLGYGGFVLDPATRAYLLTHLPDVPDALTRGSALVTLWEDMLDGRARPAEVVDVLVRGLPRERDELNLQRMLAYVQQGFWKFLPDASRHALGPKLEARAARRPGRRRDRQPEIRLVLRAPRHGADAGHAEMAREGLATRRGRTGAGARGAGFHHARRGARGSRRPLVAGDSRTAAGANGESRSEGPIRLRAAGAFVRRRRPRRVLRQPPRRAEPPPRAVGPRSARRISITRSAPRRRASTSRRVWSCSRRSGAPATSSSPNGGWTPRCRATDPRARRRWCGSSSPPPRAITRIGCAGRSSRRPTISFARPGEAASGSGGSQAAGRVDVRNLTPQAISARWSRSET